MTTQETETPGGSRTFAEASVNDAFAGYERPTPEAVDATLDELLSHTEKWEFTQFREVTFGGIRAAYGTWGKPKDNNAIKREAQAQGVLDRDLREMINHSGFTSGCYYGPDANLFSPEFQAMQAVRAALLAKTVADARGEKTIGHLIVGSVSSMPDTDQRAARVLRAWGYEVEDEQFYGQACNSAIAGLMDYTRLHQFDEQPGLVIAVGLESLTGAQVEPTDIKLKRTFGNGGGAIGLVPGVDMIHLVGETFVKADDGIITIPSVYDLPRDGQLPLYPWYRIDENAKDRIVRTSRGVLLRMYDVKHRFAQMFGGKTIKFFMGNVPDLALDNIIDYAEYFAPHFGPLAPYILSHQPSKPVNTGNLHSLNKRLGRIHESWMYRGREIAQFARQFLPKGIRSPWVMDKARVNNISAGTWIVDFVENVAHNRVSHDRTTLVLGLGVGSVMEVDFVFFPHDQEKARETKAKLTAIYAHIDKNVPNIRHKIGLEHKPEVT